MTGAMDTRQTVEMITSEACVALFEHYSMALLPTRAGAEVTPELAYCAVIGYSSEKMRGTLLLATTAELLARTAPVDGDAMRDWIAELANQLLGRIKAQLAARGLLLGMSTPILLRGQHLRPMPNHEAEPLVFQAAAGWVCVWMDAEITSDLDLSHLQPDDGLNAGEALLF
jgi:hypothetical protein